MIDYIISRLNSFSLDTQGLTPQNLLKRSRSKFSHVPSSKTLVIGLPGWSQKLWTWKVVEKHMAQAGISSFIYEFPRLILSHDHQLTLECFNSIATRVREDIKNLKQEYGFDECIVVGISLASSFGSMIYKNNSDITKIYLIAPGENLARDMWHGCRTQHLRISYQSQAIDRVMLEKYWTDLASENNFPHIDSKIYIFYGKNDKVIPFRLSVKLGEILHYKGNRTYLKFFPIGHYLLIFWFLLNPKRFFSIPKIGYGASKTQEWSWFPACQTRRAGNSSSLCPQLRKKALRWCFCLSNTLRRENPYLLYKYFHYRIKTLKERFCTFVTRYFAKSYFIQIS